MSPDRIRPGSARQGADETPESPLETTEQNEELVDHNVEDVASVDDEPVEETEDSFDDTEDSVEEETESIDGEVDEQDEFVDAADSDESITAADVLEEDADEPVVRSSRRRRREQANIDIDEEVIVEDAPLVVSGGARERSTSVFRRLYYGETTFEFVRRARIWYAISALVILAGIGSLATRGLDLSIDFVGGTSWTVQSKTLTVADAQTAVNATGLSGATITVLGNNSTHSRTVEVEAKLPKGQSSATTQNEASKVGNALANVAHTSSEKVSIDTVGPSWGGQITHKAIVALIVFFILIALYISIFFEWRMAFAAIIAVIHDILITVGIYSLTGLLVTPDTVVAILTILGYSLYDTIVVFDRVRDNLHHLSVRDRMTVTDIVNLSMNQTLARSVNTSLVAIMPILAVLILGAEILGASTLQYFGIALLVGLTCGAYSSIFIASPLVANLKEREQRFRIIRERLEARGNARWLLSATAAASGQFMDGDPAGERAAARRVRKEAVRGARITPRASSLPEQPPVPETAGVARSASTGPRPAARQRPSQPRRPANRAKRKGGRR